jgi:hypothetical protein
LKKNLLDWSESEKGAFYFLLQGRIFVFGLQQLHRFFLAMADAAL